MYHHPQPLLRYWLAVIGSCMESNGMVQDLNKKFRSSKIFPRNT